MQFHRGHAHMSCGSPPTPARSRACGGLGPRHEGQRGHPHRRPRPVHRWKLLRGVEPVLGVTTSDVLPASALQRRAVSPRPPRAGWHGCRRRLHARWPTTTAPRPFERTRPGRARRLRRPKSLVRLLRRTVQPLGAQRRPRFPQRSPRDPRPGPRAARRLRPAGCTRPPHRCRRHGARRGSAHRILGDTTNELSKDMPEARVLLAPAALGGDLTSRRPSPPCPSRSLCRKASSCRGQRTPPRRQSRRSQLSHKALEATPDEGDAWVARADVLLWQGHASEATGRW